MYIYIYRERGCKGWFVLLFICQVILRNSPFSQAAAVITGCQELIFKLAWSFLMCVDFSVSICWRSRDHSLSQASSSAIQGRPEVTREEREACSFKKLLGTLCHLRLLWIADEYLFLSSIILGSSLKAVIKVQQEDLERDALNRWQTFY